jgi:hypothetical protein
MKLKLIFLFSLLAWNYSFSQSPKLLNQFDTGFRGIWYSNEPSDDQYVFKYSGGLGTYPANHYPFSVYVKEVDKTFFCYGGTDPSGSTLLHQVSFFDHKTKMVSRPVTVLDKETDNAHDNPVMNIDSDGFIWVFSTAHGTNSPAYISKSLRPYDIREFESINPTKVVDGKPVAMDNFSYLQSWYQPGKGFLNFFTHYETRVIPGQPTKPRRTIGFMKSEDGVHYSEWKDLASIAEGHYQTSGLQGNKIGTSFNYHPVKEGVNGLNFRTNLYYLETQDFGQNWQSASGEKVQLPLQSIHNPTLVAEYESNGLLVYINDLTYDEKGNPVILFVTTKGFEAGPNQGPRTWTTARFTGSAWEILPITESDNNYDMGSLYIDSKGEWRIVGPTATGPQPFNTGGEMVLWVSKNQGISWKHKPMTSGSEMNHSYARRPVNVHPDFFAFWADGHGRQKSESRLYFSDKKGNVYVLPTEMKAEYVRPLLVKKRNKL